MPYLNPQNSPSINEHTANLSSFNPDDHIRPMMQDWWRTNLAYIKHWEDKDAKKSNLSLSAIIDRFTSAMRSDPDAYEQFSTFLELTPVGELPFGSLILIGSKLKQLTQESHKKIPNYIPFLKAIRTVLVDRRGFDADTFKSLFIPPHISLDEISNSTEE